MFLFRWSTLLLLSTLVTGQLNSVPQNMTTPEEQPPGTVIGQISVPSAIPPFTIYHADRQDIRTILVSDGGLVTVGERLDRERKSLYRLIAHASNSVNVEVNLSQFYIAVALLYTLCLRKKHGVELFMITSSAVN